MLTRQELWIIRILSRTNQWSLAQRLGVSQATVSYWEIGRREIPQDMIPKILAALGSSQAKSL
jgi:DNA-binding transcriptional regulator YiaG